MAIFLKFKMNYYLNICYGIAKEFTAENQLVFLGCCWEMNFRYIEKYYTKRALVPNEVKWLTTYE